MLKTRIMDERDYKAMNAEIKHERMTALEWLNEQLQEMDSKSFNNIIQIEMGRDNYNHIIDQAKEMEKQEKLKVQIAENESVLEMLRLHGNDSSIMRVFSRLESLKEQLKEL